MNYKAKVNDFFLLSFILLVSIFIGFYGIDWGTPSLKRTLQIFGTIEDLKIHIPKMLELRDRFYHSLEKIYKGEKIESAIEQTYAHQLKSQPFDELSKEVKLDCMRGYFLGSMNSDEQRNIVAIGKLDLFKLNLNPQDFTYGGLYFYLLAGSFLVSKFFGLLSLSKNIPHYFFHPHEVANMYIIMRFVSAISVTLTILFMYLFIKKLFNKRIAFFSCLILAIFPLIVYNSKIAKPHTLGVFLTLLGSWFSLKILSEDEVKNYILSGTFFGLAFSILYVNFFSILFLYLCILIKNQFRFPSLVNRRVVYATAAFLIIFLVTNWYILPDFDKFLGRKQELSIMFNYGNFNIAGSAKFLREFFNSNLPFGLLILFLIGCIFIVKNRVLHLIPFILFIICHFLFIMSYIKHPNAFIISLPFCAVISAYGFNQSIEKKFYSQIICSAFIIFYFLINGLLHTTLSGRNGHLTLSGEWINKNVPYGSSIGVLDGWFSPGNYPAFRFLDYKLIHIPSSKQQVEKCIWPEYLISINDDLEKIYPREINSFYENLKNWQVWWENILLFKRDRAFFTENLKIRIYKKR